MTISFSSRAVWSSAGRANKLSIFLSLARAVVLASGANVSSSS
eukprot:CAMPEP_0169474920 /NCGR_PEP_ID=MMETSP1042-20121227/26524_1 /TAXON_ID=464988 /ORGANISM="Hemiselmis andersenii, Strain CCMP1180" /LENGTH=42 /DNA_ID= /DNA_START= /DNA_END= /DNA_ORIENTATION=